MSKVSLYPHIKELVNGQNILFSDLMEKIRSEEWKDKIDTLRLDIAFGASEKELAEAKNKLPYFTGSGTFSKREDKGLVQHSGKIIIDFDKLEKYTTIEAARDVLIKDKYTEYLFLSCTGRGIAVVVNIDPAKHLDSFLFLEKYYKDHYGLIVDKACKDVSRPRYISHDPQLYNATFFETVRLINNSMTVDSDDGRYEFALRLHNRKHDYVEGNRHHYLVVLAFFLNKCGVAEDYAVGRLIQEFSNAEKTPEEISKIVQHAYKFTHDFGTFAITKSVKDMPPEIADKIRAVTSFAHGINESGRPYTDTDVQSLCGQHGLNPGIVEGIFKNVYDNNKEMYGLDDKPEISRIEIFIKKLYEIKRNVITQRTEYRKARSKDPFEVLNSNTIFRKLQEAGFKFTLDKLKSLLRSDFVQEYNPFVDYFNSLPEADGVDHITALADHIETDNMEFWRTQFKKALVRSIACTIGGRENRIVITLTGAEQESGKSTFIRFLCPPELADYYTEAELDGSKDADMQLSENFFWNIEEFEGAYGHNIGKLKATLSRANVKQRRAYAEFHEKHPRRVNFWASTNRTDFLTDDQNTRWLCFNVKSVNYDYNNLKTGVRNIDISKVWAQAWQLYKEGFDYTLSKDEKDFRDQSNKWYEQSSIEKSLISKYFDLGKKDLDEFVTPTSVLMDLIQLTDGKITSKISVSQIGKVLRQLGFIPGNMRVDKVPTRGYWAKRKYSQLGNSSSNIEPKIEYGDTDKPF